jgi:hypothetical protein
VSAHTHLNPTPLEWIALPLDWVGWRIVDYKSKGKINKRIEVVVE